MQLLLCHKTELLSLLLAIGEFPGKGGPDKNSSNEAVLAVHSKQTFYLYKYQWSLNV